MAPQVLDLLAQLQAPPHTCSPIISHDLDVQRYPSAWVLVLKDGRVVEEGDTERVFASP
jgi:peptide/nickel transport system ATP-binding protein